jgi:hypothetical protein
MPAIFFDKLKAMPRLEASGLPNSQAEALTETIHEALEASVATTTDLNLMEGRLRLEISDVKTAIENSANAVTFRILGILIPVIIAAGAVQHFWK